MSKTDHPGQAGKELGDLEKKRRRPTQSLRLRDALRESISEEASRSGRSMSEEMEYRLERSFDEHKQAVAIAEYLIGRMFGDTGSQNFLSVLGKHLDTTSKHLGYPWHTTATGVRIAMAVLQRAIRVHVSLEDENVRPDHPSDDDVRAIAVDIYRKSIGIDPPSPS